MITCEQCLYWERREGDCGWCRRESPHGQDGWPLSNNDDWCGQAMPRESGSTQPVHEAAQAVVDYFSEDAPWDAELSTALLNALREALRRMKP